MLPMKFGVEIDLILVAPQGFEPRYSAPEADVLPLNEGAIRKSAKLGALCDSLIVSANQTAGQLAESLTRTTTIFEKPSLNVGGFSLAAICRMMSSGTWRSRLEFR